MATYTGQLSDFLPSELAGLAPKLWVQRERPSMGPAGPLTTVRKPVALSPSWTFSFDVVPSVEMVPETRYTLGITWANGRDLDVLSFVAAPGGGPIKDMHGIPLTRFFVGIDPPRPPADGEEVWWLDMTNGDLKEWV